MKPTFPALVQAVVAEEEARVRRLVLEATNAGDSAAFVAAFTSGGAVDDWGREFPGADGISGGNDRENIGVQATWDPAAVRTENGAHVVTATVGGNGFDETRPP